MHLFLNLRKVGVHEPKENCLTPWWPVYWYVVPGNRPKTSSFWLSYQHHSSSADCAKELFKPPKMQ